MWTNNNSKIITTSTEYILWTKRFDEQLLWNCTFWPADFNQAIFNSSMNCFSSKNIFKLLGSPPRRPKNKKITFKHLGILIKKFCLKRLPNCTDLVFNAKYCIRSILKSGRPMQGWGFNWCLSAYKKATSPKKRICKILKYFPKISAWTDLNHFHYVKRYK